MQRGSQRSESQVAASSIQHPVTRIQHPDGTA